MSFVPVMFPKFIDLDAVVNAKHLPTCPLAYDIAPDVVALVPKVAFNVFSNELSWTGVICDNPINGIRNSANNRFFILKIFRFIN